MKHRTHNLFRRLIAALVLVLMTVMLVGPAFAGYLACGPDGAEGSSCCCDGDEDDTQSSVEEPGCCCGGCACAERPEQSTPFFPAQQAEIEIVAAIAPALDSAEPAPSRTAVRWVIRPNRGPPDGALTPLYLLFDSLLI